MGRCAKHALFPGSCSKQVNVATPSDSASSNASCHCVYAELVPKHVIFFLGVILDAHAFRDSGEGEYARHLRASGSALRWARCPGKLTCIGPVTFLGFSQWPPGETRKE